jgi:hypothetical protein
MYVRGRLRLRPLWLFVCIKFALVWKHYAEIWLWVSTSWPACDPNVRVFFQRVTRRWRGLLSQSVCCFYYSNDAILWAIEYIESPYKGPGTWPSSDYNSFVVKVASVSARVLGSYITVLALNKTFVSFIWLLGCKKYKGLSAVWNTLFMGS